MKQKMSLGLLNENLGRNLMCVVVVLGLIFGLSGGVNAAGTNVCGEQEQVVTIYFAGTDATVDWWKWYESGFLSPELVATLYHEQDFTPSNQHTTFINGIDPLCPLATEKKFGVNCRGWNTCLTEAETFLDDTLQNTAGNVTLNLVGWSRGGVLSIMMADKASSRERVKKINILAVDPVPGDLGFNKTYFCLNDKVNQYVGIYAKDERSWMFAPVIPSFAGNTKVWMFTVPGSHETLVGSTEVDGHSIDLDFSYEKYDYRLDSVSWVTKVTAVELLGSSQWGNVEFNWDWQCGLNNEDDVKNRFLGKVEDMYAYPEYSLMHDYGFLFLLESYRFEFGVTDCWLVVETLIGSQHEPRCSSLWDGQNLNRRALTNEISPMVGLTSWSMLQELGNSPPVANANGPYEDEEGSAITFDASGSCDPDDDLLEYRWDFGNDGSWDTEWAQSPTASYTWGDDHTGTAKVEVNDGKFTDTATASITVNNIAPTASIDSIEQPNPHFILPHHLLTFNGSFTDPGWLDTHTATWDFYDGTVVAGTLTEENEQPDSTGTSTADHAYSEPGDYMGTLTVTDDDDGIGTDTSTVTIISAEEAIPIVDEYIQDLPDDAFKNNPDQRKNVFSKKLDDVIELIDAGEHQKAIDKLQHERAKADGYVDGNPKNDWITDPGAQQEICTMIDDLIAYLETLL